MTTASNLQANGSTTYGKTTREQTLCDEQSEMGTAPFGTSLMERISSVFAGLGLSVAFGLTATILAMAMRT